MGNVFALLGLRALFVLVDGLVRRFRYLDQTVAVVLAFVGMKLLIEGFVKIPPLPSLAVVAGLFALGIAASLVGDRRAAAGAQGREGPPDDAAPDPPDGPDQEVRSAPPAEPAGSASR